jgi:amidase
MIKRAALALVLALAVQRSAPPAFPLEEATAVQLQDWMTSGRYTARQVAELYLRRIEEIDRGGPALHAVIEVNPDALDIAERT